MYNENGWLEKYLRNRGKYISETTNDLKVDSTESLDYELLFYEKVQPTGFIYGHPLSLPEMSSDEFASLSNEELTKLSLTETLILCAKLFDTQAHSDKQVIEDIIAFYKFLFPELKGNFFINLFVSKQNRAKKAENFIEKQLNLRASIDNFWAGFFLNSLLFVDIIYFSIWLQNRANKNNGVIRKQREEIFMILLQIISIAINADNRLEDREIQFYNLLLKSSKLSDANHEIAKEYLHYPPKLVNIDLRPVSSWLLKKYVLEMAIIAVWADKDVEGYELKFLRDLAHKLELSQDELNESMMAVEAFVLNNWESVPYLQGKKSYEVVSNRFIDGLKRSIDTNKQKLAKEFSESKELMSLLKKSIQSDLTPEESEIVKKQILDILKTIPMFVIFVLPGSFITLPLLFKIVPKNILYPSAYLDDNLSK